LTDRPHIPLVYRKRLRPVIDTVTVWPVLTGFGGSRAQSDSQKRHFDSIQ